LRRRHRKILPRTTPHNPAPMIKSEALIPYNLPSNYIKESKSASWGLKEFFLTILQGRGLHFRLGRSNLLGLNIHILPEQSIKLWSEFF
jgi:hypothetical protein